MPNHIVCIHDPAGLVEQCPACAPVLGPVRARCRTWDSFKNTALADEGAELQRQFEELNAKAKDYFDRVEAALDRR